MKTPLQAISPSAIHRKASSHSRWGPAINKSLGVLLGKICQYVYDFDPASLPVLGNPTATKVSDKATTPTSFAGVLRYSDKTVLAFQGTITQKTWQSVKDWLQNFRVKRIKAMGLPGMVHEGFVTQLQMVWDGIVANLKNNTQPLYVTGHSQGAAVAALATKALTQAGIPVTATYTFAAPRPGDDAFADSVTTPVYRFEFGDDVVPHVPFHSLSLGGFEDSINARLMAHAPQLAELMRTASEGYRSVGRLYYGRPGEQLQENLDAAAEDRLARARYMLMLMAGSDLFNHHHMPNYIGMLG